MDLRNMTATEALRAAKDASGLSVDELHRRTGISTHVLTQYFRNQDGYLPALDKVPSLCRATGNTLLLQWLEAQLASDGYAATPLVPTRTDMLTAVARVGSAFGDVQRLAAEAQMLYPCTAREIRSALGDVIAACRNAQTDLQPLAEQRDPRMALASLVSAGESKKKLVEMPVPKRDRSRWAFWRRG